MGRKREPDGREPQHVVESRPIVEQTQVRGLKNRLPRTMWIRSRSPGHQGTQTRSPRCCVSGQTTHLSSPPSEGACSTSSSSQFMLPRLLASLES